MKLKHGLILLVVAALLFAGFPVAAQDDVTLVVWDNWTRDAEQEMIETLNAEFEEAHPGVTIQREIYATDDLTNILPLELSSENGPDVTMINQGYGGMGALVEAGLLLPLNDYADQYGWWDRYAAGLHSRNSFSEDGKQFGVGNLYGVSVTAEVVGVYYHRDLFESHGLEVPQTLAELETLMNAPDRRRCHADRVRQPGRLAGDPRIQRAAGHRDHPGQNSTRSCTGSKGARSTRKPI